jgi:hypothetical protein
MTGQINATYDEEGMVIDMTNITLNRIMQEIESRRYQMSNTKV